MFIKTALTTLALAASTTAVSLSYDTGYDLESRSLESVTCSNGENGLMTRFGWETQGDTPNFPNIGGAPGVEWNSADCGSCWELTYEGNSINVMAVDLAVGGYVISLTAMDALTNGMGEELGRVEVEATQVEASVCGIEE